MRFLFFILLWGQITMGQDSVLLKVTWSKKIADTVYYRFKILETGERVKSVCVCKEWKKRGSIVKVARKDIQFIKNDL